ncbi:NUMOD4 domain-containing protein [Leuconostoc citreum]|uniref:NUMOD4 domain-containing protein n=1 Tax=Leuconostoc citreum TaxID=33964 RepID=UPI000BFF05D0|nr:NUMOD4 domain-containing protein [Leuconostoc citreum]
MKYDEQWKDIEEYEGLYQVSNYGEVRSLDRQQTHIINGKERTMNLKGKVLSKINTADGYHYVALSKEGNLVPHRISRLVAQAFIPNPDNLPQVNHMDEDRKNNHVGNLEWCTAKYNNNYGNRKAKIINSLSVMLKVTFKDGSYEVYSSRAEASEKLGISKGSISRWANGHTKCRRGMKFEYLR